jgi:hypothetical protein
MLDKYFFLFFNSLLILLIFYLKNKRSYFILFFYFIFIFFLIYNIYFFVVNSERVTYNKIKYNNLINKTDINEVFIDIQNLDSIINFIKIETKKDTIIDQFYKRILQQAKSLKYINHEVGFSNHILFKIVTITSNYLPFAKSDSKFLVGNGMCVENMPNKSSFLNKLKSSEYMCCGDYVYITGKVLEQLHIKYRFVYTTQHVYMEVFSDNKWILVDVTTGVIYDSDYFDDDGYSVYFLPNLSFVENSQNNRNSFYFLRDLFLKQMINNKLKNHLYKETCSSEKFELKYLNTNN